jgi:hypothetical protein
VNDIDLAVALLNIAQTDVGVAHLRTVRKLK